MRVAAKEAANLRLHCRRASRLKYTDAFQTHSLAPRVFQEMSRLLGMRPLGASLLQGSNHEILFVKSHLIKKRQNDRVILGCLTRTKLLARSARALAGRGRRAAGPRPRAVCGLAM